MSSKHHISHASELFYGDASNAALQAANGRPGIPFQPLTKVSLGAPKTLDADAIIKAATGTQLPNTETVTYTTATAPSDPLDGAITAPSTVFLNGQDRLVWVLDVPRNITCTVTHGSTSVAMTVRVSGYDQYGVPMVENIVCAAASTATYPGKKAFKWVYSIAITAVADAEANALDVGWGDVLGLPYKLASKSDFLTAWVDDVIESLGTVVAAVTTSPATAITGDVRGTYTATAASNNTKVFKVWAAFDPETLGVTQYGG